MNHRVPSPGASARRRVRRRSCSAARTLGRKLVSADVRRRAARTAVAGRGAAAGRCRRGPARLHGLPQGALAADLVKQSAGAAQPRAEAADGRRRHLPESRRGGAAGRRGPRRAARRVDRRAPLPDRGRPAQAGAGVAAGARSQGDEVQARRVTITRGCREAPVHHLRGRGRQKTPRAVFHGTDGEVSGLAATVSPPQDPDSPDGRQEPR